MPKDVAKRDRDDRALPLRDGPEWRQALAEASVQSLLMVYVHLTHDAAILDRFAPHIHPPLFGRPSDLPAGLVADLRDRLLDVLTRPGAATDTALPLADPRAYLGIMGITVPGYPNFFLTVGPNSAPNHAAGQNLISEAQIHYIIECPDLITVSGARTIGPTREAFVAWNEKIDRRMHEMIWMHTRTPVREHFILR